MAPSCVACPSQFRQKLIEDVGSGLGALVRGLKPSAQTSRTRVKRAEADGLRSGVPCWLEGRFRGALYQRGPS